MVFATGMLTPPAPAAPPAGAPPPVAPEAVCPGEVVADEDGHAVRDAPAFGVLVLAEPEEHAAAVIASAPVIATKTPVLDLVI
jgi:hypothetical protein